MCLGQVIPSNETCDYKDNNCDGTVDNDRPGTPCQARYVCGLGPSDGVWECAADGTFMCSADLGGSDHIPGGVEVCDGVDNDCNGQVDEPDAFAEIPRCSLTEGTCAGEHFKVCDSAAGIWLACSTVDYGPLYEPTREVSCDAVDNDCDGQTDEGCGQKPAPPGTAQWVCERLNQRAHQHLKGHVQSLSPAASDGTSRSKTVTISVLNTEVTPARAS